MKLRIKSILVTGLSVFTLAISPLSGANAVISAVGDAADIQPAVDSYRALLGQFGGHQEFTWDDSDPEFVDAGLVVSTSGSGFQFGTADDLATLAGDAGNFTAFSGPNLIVSSDSPVIDVSFTLGGSTSRGSTNGFGAVFSGVEAFGFSVLDFYDEDTNLILSEVVPVGGPGSLSFVGVAFDQSKVFTVTVTAGEEPISAGGNLDHVALDNVIFANPVPEPSSVFFLLGGLILALARRR